jgi:N4-gp56 family major capsid protein
MAAPSSMTGKTQTANATPDRYMPLRALEVRDYNMQWYGLLPHVKVPEGNSDTVTFHRWPHLALPTAELAEGDNGTPQQLSTERVTCVLQTHGAHVKVSSLSEKITIGSPKAVAADRLGVQQARVVDREITRQAMGATTKYYPGAVTARSGLGVSDTISSVLMKKVRARLRRAGAPAYSGNRFVMIAGPEVCADMQNDSLFLNAAAYQKWEVLVSSELGEWHGFRIVESNTVPSFVLLSSTNATVTDEATGSGETDLDDDTYYVLMTANDTDGFETGFYAIQSATLSGDVLQVITPAAPTGYSSFNIYVGTDSTGIDATLQYERAAASTTFRITANGVAASGTAVTYGTTGRIPGVAPASGVTVHPVWFFGAEFMKCTELSKVQWHRVTTPDSNNPLLRYMSVGWVLEGFRALITDQSFGGCIEVATAN